MASKAVLLLSLNMVIFSAVNCTYVPCPPSLKAPEHKHHPSLPVPNKQPTCSKDILKFGVCADVLGLVHAKLGKPPKTPCCSLIEGLADVEAALCLCTALKADVLGINLNLPINLSLILNHCGKPVPRGFECA